MINLSGKTALVTGGARGIGKEISLKLAQAGANVGLIYLNSNPTKETEEKLKAFKADYLFLKCDVSDMERCRKIVDSALNKFGKIDILVNNAAITRDSLLIKMSPDDWSRVIDVNLTGVFHMCKALIRPMLKQKYGRIINIGSVVGFSGNSGQLNYSASKAGLIGLTKALSQETASRNITCNLIAPGFVKSKMTDKLSEKQKLALLNEIPMKRIGTAEDIANGVLFLASSMADYITGTTLHINGGLF